jgi:hypothetical protein
VIRIENVTNEQLCALTADDVRAAPQPEAAV